MVDDEPNIVEGLAARLRKKFDIATAVGGEQGIRALGQGEPFTVIVSDLRMPGMDGATFFGHVRQMAPDSVRILLTGQADLEGAMAAINQGHIFRFLTKPCPADVITRAIDDAIEQARLITRDRVLLEQKLEAMTAHLLHAERLATLGTMSGVVGHELNNLLATFNLCLHEVKTAKKRGQIPGDEAVDALEKVKHHIELHASNLLNLARPTKRKDAHSDLCKLVSDTVAMMRMAGVPSSIRLTLSVAPAPVPVVVDRTRIEQVLVNLIRNAVDAVGEMRGRPHVIKVEVTRDLERRIGACAITDNGCGIPEEARSAIFEPYFTTKPPDRGTGLGLSVVKQIVESYRGALVLESEVGVGTTFKFELPLVCEDAGS